MSTDRTLNLKADDKCKGDRLDVWLGQNVEIQSRNQALKLIEGGNVKVSGVPSLKVKASYRLRGDEEILVTLPEVKPSKFKAENIPIEIFYQDNDLAVVMKPAGLVTHPAAGHFDGTLVNALLYHFSDLSQMGGEERPGLVHRLDKETSGLLVVAKNDKAHKGLSDLFRSHNIHRVYWALVLGVPKESKQTITTKLARHPKNRMAFCSQEQGKEAITHYEVIKTFKNIASLVQITLGTGRTHQIRVHMSEMGHPILGDKVYGVKRQKALISNPQLKKLLSTMTRHALHATELGFEHPRTKQIMKFAVDWPKDISPLLSFLNSLK